MNKTLLILIIVLLVALAVIVYWQKGGFAKSYWAVYLNTGDLYFGELHEFPTLHLTDTWFIQRNAQDAANPFTLANFSQAFWKPESEIYLNDKDIVWKAKLQDSSPILAAIKNPQPNQPASSSTMPK